MSSEQYTLKMLQKELESSLGVKGMMRAYESLSETTGRSVCEVRRWFTSPEKTFHKLPPMDKDIWDYLERLSGYKLKRTTYYPKPNFWDDCDNA